MLGRILEKFTEERQRRMIFWEVPWRAAEMAANTPKKFTWIHPAEAPENNSIARVCHEAQDLALGEKFSSAPTRAENMDAVQQCWQIATAACELRNCHQLVRNSASTALG